MFALYENGKQPKSGINSLFITYCVICDRLLLMISCQSGMNFERATYILGALLNLFLFFVLKHVQVNKSKFTQAELTRRQSLIHGEGVTVTIGRSLLT